MKKFKKLILILTLFLLAVLGVFQVILSNQLATQGKNQKNLEEEKAQLWEENAFLENELARLSSISYLEKKATEAGFVKTSQVLYLTPQVPVAQILKTR